MNLKKIEKLLKNTLKQHNASCSKIEFKICKDGDLKGILSWEEDDGNIYYYSQFWDKIFGNGYGELKAFFAKAFDPKNKIRKY